MDVMRRFATPLVLVALLAGACSYTPITIAPELPDVAQSSTMYASDGTLLTVLHGEENRVNVRFEQMPQHLIDAVVAIEDERFWLHRGVDPIGLVRAVRRNVAEGGIRQGGSTITQQTVKNLLLERERSLGGKLEEASLALQLERTHSKERVLELYLNSIYFGKGAYGVEAASRTYFNKSVSDITLSEAAVLAGLIKFPNAANPIDYPTRALDRRDIVLDAMLDQELITLEVHQQTLGVPLPPRVITTRQTDRYSAPHFVEEVKQWFLSNPEFGETRADRVQLLFGGGLRIHTTIDLDLQAKAEAARDQILPDPAIHPEVSIVALEPRTGRVRAMVGGRDFWGESQSAKYNLAMGVGRGPGSSYKPFVLATALTQGMSLNRTYPAPGTRTFTFSPGTPEWNVSGGGGGSANLTRMTVSSLNTAYAALMLDVGPANATAMARELGITTPQNPVPAAVLGSENVTPLDMANAYATFANSGLHVPPTFVDRIVRVDGTILWEHTHTQRRVLSVDIADTITNILVQATSSGTGRNAVLPGRPVAGKTGTGTGHKDAWFVGYTPQLATAVWVGFPDEEIAMRPPVTPSPIFGGGWPAQIWRAFMTQAMEDQPVLAFRPMPTTTRPPSAGPRPTAPPTSPPPPADTGIEGGEGGDEGGGGDVPVDG
jgi:penicillin-binding protein 1A